MTDAKLGLNIEVCQWEMGEVPASQTKPNTSPQGQQGWGESVSRVSPAALEAVLPKPGT